MKYKSGWPDFWLGRGAKSLMLLPLSKIVEKVAAARLARFKCKDESSKVPTLVVGNVSVGGSGKTPFILCLGKELIARGINFGVVSRGYGGKAESWPQVVSADSEADLVGDEPVLIAKVLGCPLVVAPQRDEAVAKLLEISEVDLVISDDGLQHYSLARDIELVMLDSTRANGGVGNGLCIPAGPLRESVSRLADVDYVVFNGGMSQDFLETRAVVGEMNLRPSGARNLVTGKLQPLEKFKGSHVSAVAGIGNPQRFFKSLVGLGIGFDAHAFADHHSFSKEDFARMPQNIPVFMTAKDAVKCKDFAQDNWWSVDVDAVCSAELMDRLLLDIESLIASKKGREE